MRILIDECVDERLRHAFPGHDCQTARHAGMSGFKNGQLIEAAGAAGFDVVLTVDQGFAYEQNLRGQKIAIDILHGRSNRPKDLLPLIPDCIVLMESIKPGQVARVEKPANSPES